MDRTPGPAARPDPTAPPHAVEPLPFTPTAWRGPAASVPSPREPRRYGPFTAVQWAGTAATCGLAGLVAVFFAVVITRVLRALPPVAAFVETFPGSYPPPAGSPEGFPGWVGWTHFLTTFLLLGIIRSGLEIRRGGRPAITLVPRWNRRRRMSLAVWFHQGLDILWILNGLVYVVLLAVSGRWVRVVPTSVEVVPNAASALLQYVSLDWPVEDSWTTYNSLQQLAYFAIVFVASPLAIASGVRLSGLWPRRVPRLDRLYPRIWAERLHWPVTLFFVAFIVVHVALVFATGALRNLGHMYAGTDEVGWTGFWIFVVSTLALVAFWAAMRPRLLVPIARLFGTVSGG